MLTVQEAHHHISETIFRTESELIDFRSAIGRVLSETITAPFSQPRFDQSAMDGFAVRSADVQNANRETPTTLKVIGVQQAGGDQVFRLDPNTCTQIMTGAELPINANAIVRVEDTSGFDHADFVQIFRSVTKGKDTRYKGEEIQSGTDLIPIGTKITPAEIGVLATFGISEISLFKKPKVALFTIGDELREASESISRGQIYDSNLPIMRTLTELAECEIIFSETLKDDRDHAFDFLSKAIEIADVVISAGGISVGRFDYVRETLIKIGVDQKFSEVAQKPGRPFFFGNLSDRNCLVFGLPGNPIAAMINFIEYIFPTLQLLNGAAIDPKLTAILTETFHTEPIKHRFLFGSAQMTSDGLRCLPTKKLGSHMITAPIGMNCVIESPPMPRPIEKGEKVEMRLLPWKTIR